jgi:hypothetical protein
MLMFAGYMFLVLVCRSSFRWPLLVLLALFVLLFVVHSHPASDAVASVAHLTYCYALNHRVPNYTMASIPIELSKPEKGSHLMCLEDGSTMLGTHASRHSLLTITLLYCSQDGSSMLILAMVVLSMPSRLSTARDNTAGSPRVS